jgi:hypothetical protein
MDISRIKETDTAEYELQHPVDRSRLGIVFTLAGPENPKRRKLAISYSRTLRQRMNRTGKLTLDDPETDFARDTEYLVTCTLGWQGLEIDGAALEYSVAAARTLYETVEYAWVRRQILEALNQQDLFIASSASA